MEGSVSLIIIKYNFIFNERKSPSSAFTKLLISLTPASTFWFIQWADKEYDP